MEKSQIDSNQPTRSMYSVLIWALGSIPVIAVFAFVFILARSPVEEATSACPEMEDSDTAGIEETVFFSEIAIRGCGALPGSVLPPQRLQANTIDVRGITIARC